MKTCSVFDDMNLIRGAWVSQMTTDQNMACLGRPDRCKQLDKLVQNKFKELLTHHAKDIKLGLVTVNDLLETSAIYAIENIN